MNPNQTIIVAILHSLNTITVNMTSNENLENVRLHLYGIHWVKNDKLTFSTHDSKDEFKTVVKIELSKVNRDQQAQQDRTYRKVGEIVDAFLPCDSYIQINRVW